MSDCLFCSLASGTGSAVYRHQDDQVAAFNDIAPKAPVHVLVVPKKHIASVAELEPDDEQLIGHLVRTAKELAESLGIAADGYRLVFNTRAHGGQEIEHLHLHLLGGRPLGTMV